MENNKLNVILEFDSDGKDEFLFYLYRLYINNHYIFHIGDWRETDHGDWLINGRDFSITIPNFQDYFSNFNELGVTNIIPEEWVAFALEYDIAY